MKNKILITGCLLILVQNLFGQKYYDRSIQNINDFSLSGDGEILAYGKNNDIILRDANSNQLILALENGHGRPVTALSFFNSGNNLISGGRDSLLVNWSLNEEVPVEKINAHRGVITSIACNPEQNIVATAATDRTIFIWDGDDLTKTHELNGHDDDIFDLLFYKEKFLISCSADQNIIIWNIDTGEMINQWQAGDDWLRAMDKIPGRNHIAACGDAGKVKVWDLNDMRNVKLLLELKISDDWLLTLNYLKPATFVTGGQNRRVSLIYPNGKYVYNPKNYIDKAAFLPTEGPGFKLIVSANGTGIFLLNPYDMNSIYY